MDNQQELIGHQLSTLFIRATFCFFLCSLLLSVSVLAQPRAAADVQAEQDAIHQITLRYMNEWYSLAGREMMQKQLPDWATVNDLAKKNELQLLSDSPKSSRRHYSPFKIKILDLYNNSASVRIEVANRVDYLHLIKSQAGWQVVNVHWEATAPHQQSYNAYTPAPKFYKLQNFEIGDYVAYSQVDVKQMNPGKSGQYIIWDFLDLPFSKDTLYRTVSAPKYTPYDDQFPRANRVLLSNDSTFVFLHNAPDSTDILGYIQAKNDLFARYSRPYSFAKRPFRLGNTYQETAVREGIVQEIPYIHYGEIITTADGFGTLILPSGVFEGVIRIKEEQFFKDTYDNSPPNFLIRSTAYHWFDSQHSFPILSMRTVITTANDSHSRKVSVQYAVE